ncbi:MAG: Cof-type HAD-IIB family hydrolase [Firmicutes bacterium]|nr:Cof-type HAD-IIB family hydrolase [Bacillota bacterium]
MIKMVVTDLDGTLLRTDKSVSKYTVDILSCVREQGVKVVFATARGASAKAFVSYDLFDGYVLLNGAEAFVNNRLVYDKTIPADIFGPFLRELSGRNFRVAAEIKGTHYANFDVKGKWFFIENYILTDFADVAGSAGKLYIMIEDPGQIDFIAAILPRELYFYLNRDSLVMVMHKEATKSNGIYRIAEELNIEKSEIVAFGDDINDKEMLQNVGLGVAMGNSIAEVKMIADYVCDTNDNDGVAKWLEENILRKRQMV